VSANDALLRRMQVAGVSVAPVVRKGIHNGRFRGEGVGVMH
jgi:hypothetical protein